MDNGSSQYVEWRLHRVQQIHSKAGANLVVSMLERSDGQLLESGHLAISGIQRSLFTTAGFCQMVRLRNPIVAFPLMRQELDTAMRLNAAWLVDDRRHLLRALGSDSLNTLRDANGNRLTDSLLHSELTKTFPSVSRLYHTLSGHVHMSALAISHPFDSTDEGMVIRLASDGTDDDWDDCARCATVVDYVVALRCVLAVSSALVEANVAEANERLSAQTRLDPSLLLRADLALDVELPQCPQSRTEGTRITD